jgi:hypothetical protein
VSIDSSLIKTFTESFENKLSSTYLIEEELLPWQDSISSLIIQMPKISKIDDRWRFPIAFDSYDNEFWYGGTALFYGYLDWGIEGVNTQITPSLGESGQYEGAVIGLALHEVKVSPWIAQRSNGMSEKIETYSFNFGGYEIPQDLRNCNFYQQFKQEIPVMYLSEYGMDAMQIVKDVFPIPINNPLTLYIVEALSKALGDCVILHGLPSTVAAFNEINSEIEGYSNKLKLVEGAIL